MLALYYIMQNLEYYLNTTFPHQKFIPFKRVVRNFTDSEIVLSIPSDIEGYKVVTHMGCQVS